MPASFISRIGLFPTLLLNGVALLYMLAPMDNRRRVRYHSDVGLAWFLLVVGAALGAVLAIWVLPGRRPKYLLTFIVFAASAALFLFAFDSVLWSCVALGLAAFTVAAKVEARKSSRPSAREK
ncbi:hypothetical protein [Actinoplanes couchii]|uniref:DUF1294 domain-containing protein n=1 Tax=Actinoplanes couchii TaxID=403638 RepID=A0ABQ3WZV5_9ACTN|nr:hypothetical protein [Actinoplanes couchii]MDR6316060.1 uncharacterized membrane protein YoaK (UPF0700 family) [Actinoplanes couchii]GID51675.1 hypothetical protein Aco03nite_000790 [Actinoplanes couchii]